MAGEAKTSAFMLSEATVMIGAQDKLFELNPATNSIGLVKNFSITAEPTYTDLTQGIRNTLVYSVLTNNQVKATMEVYEYTASNLAYGLGLDGSTMTSLSPDSYETSTAIVGDGTTTLSIVLTAETDTSATFPVDSWFYVQAPGSSDVIHLTRVASAAYSAEDHTMTLGGVDAVPTGVTLPVGSTVSPVNYIPVGLKQDQPFFSAKIAGVMPNGEPLVVLIPKIRVTKGFTVMFSNGGQNQYGNLPYEFTPYELLPGDPNYALFAGKGYASIFSRQ